MHCSLVKWLFQFKGLCGGYCMPSEFRSTLPQDGFGGVTLRGSLLVDGNPNLRRGFLARTGTLARGTPPDSFPCGILPHPIGVKRALVPQLLHPGWQSSRS
jgi:hypothetical protein